MASRRQQFTVKRFGPKLKVVKGRFFPNGTSTAALTVKTDGGVVSVIRTSNAGEFTITLADAYYDLNAYKLSLQHPTAANLMAQLGAVSNLGTATPTTIIVRTQAGATGTDITADANASVAFEFEFNDSSVNRNV